MTERIKLDPLLNRLVIFKLHGHAQTLDATILSFDKSGYWIKGGSLAEFLGRSATYQVVNDVHYMEFRKIEWLKAAPQTNSKQPSTDISRP